MAKPLDDRIAAALKPGSRLSDCEDLVIEITAEVERVKAAQASAEDRRTDPAVGEAEAAEANLEVEEAKLRLMRLDRAAAALGDAIAAKKASESERSARNRHEQARKRRDDLAAELSERVGPMLDELVALLGRLVDSDSEVAEVNRMTLPDDCEKLESAEVIARGKHARGHLGHKLIEMKIPLFDYPGLAWPNKGRDAKADAQRAVEAAAERDRLNAEREASKARYLISVGTFRGSFPAAFTDDGKIPVRGTVSGWCYPNQAEINRKLGFDLQPWTEEGAERAEALSRAFESSIA